MNADQALKQNKAEGETKTTPFITMRKGGKQQKSNTPFDPNSWTYYQNRRHIILRHRII